MCSHTGFLFVLFGFVCVRVLYGVYKVVFNTYCIIPRILCVVYATYSALELKLIRRKMWSKNLFQSKQYNLRTVQIQFWQLFIKWNVMALFWGKHFSYPNNWVVLPHTVNILCLHYAFIDEFHCPVHFLVCSVSW